MHIFLIFIFLPFILFFIFILFFSIFLFFGLGWASMYFIFWAGPSSGWLGGERWLTWSAGGDETKLQVISALVRQRLVPSFCLPLLFLLILETPRAVATVSVTFLCMCLLGFPVQCASLCSFSLFCYLPLYFFCLRFSVPIPSGFGLCFVLLWCFFSLRSYWFFLVSPVSFFFFFGFCSVFALDFCLRFWVTFFFWLCFLVLLCFSGFLHPSGDGFFLPLL